MEPTWWNLIPTYFDGIAFTIPLLNFEVHWYGVMYIFAFLTAYITMWKINSKENLGYTKEQFDNLFVWAIAGILIGARLGYVFFYKPAFGTTRRSSSVCRSTTTATSRTSSAYLWRRWPPT